MKNLIINYITSIFCPIMVSPLSIKKTSLFTAKSSKELTAAFIFGRVRDDTTMLE